MNVIANPDLMIREASEADADSIWSILHPIVLRGEEYCFPCDWTKEDSIAYWFQNGHTVYVAQTSSGDTVGTYFIHANQKGNGSHVCNCGFAVFSGSMHKGIGTKMCEHSLEQAKRMGYYAMQFNFVISSNTRAVSLWERMGFDIVGRIPNAFKSPAYGLVTAFVMYKIL